MGIDLRLKGTQCQHPFFLFMHSDIDDLFLDSVHHILKSVIKHLRLISGGNDHIQLQIILSDPLHGIRKKLYVTEKPLRKDTA